jgi:TRAP-type C4-dicarboxylate transport system permease small subunit
MTRWRELATRTCGLIATGFLVAMMLLTVADVVLRATANFPIRGVYDLVELLLVGCFFFALPCSFLRDENIVVNTIDEYVPWVVPLLKRGANVLAFIILAIMVWQGLIAASDSFAFHDVTGDLGLPRYWHWLGLLIGLSGAALAALAMVFAREQRQ